MRDLRAVILLAVLLVVSSFGFAQLAPSDAAAAEAAMKTIRPAAMRAHMRFLSDGLLQGRAPGTTGYDIAATYIAAQMESVGLKPAGVSGSWFQPVPLRKFQSVAEQTSLELLKDHKSETLVFGKEYVTAGDPEHSDSVLNAPAVFVGYGVSAPEMKYDDYAGLDVRGKAVVLLYGAPVQFPSVQRAYYSDIVIKQRSAVERGAVGFLVIITPEDEKRWPWQWLAPQVQAGGLKWMEADGRPQDSFPQIRGGMLMLNQLGAEKLFAGAPKSLDQVLAGAREATAQHFPLSVTVKLHAVTLHAAIQSPNVVGVWPGSDPKLRHEYVVYSAHLDHIGTCAPINGDNVCHGAIDNASGAAALLEIARAHIAVPRAPRRSILFVFVTAEEEGLLGSDYFAVHPTVEADTIVANLNIDAAPGLRYPIKDIVAVGAEASSLGKDAKRAARQLQLEVSPDTKPDEVFFIRSDQFPFVRRGVPSLLIMEGWKTTDPKINAEQVYNNWLATMYHTPKDNMSQHLDFDSAVKGVRFNFLLGYEVAQQATRPTWNRGNFFASRFATARR